MHVRGCLRGLLLHGDVSEPRVDLHRQIAEVLAPALDQLDRNPAITVTPDQKSRAGDLRDVARDVGLVL